MSEPRPSLKLTFGKKKQPEETPPQPTPPPAPSQPASETPQRKLTLKIARKPTEDGTDAKPKKKKPSSSKKRPADEPALKEPSAAAAAPQPAGPKRLKLNPSKKPGVQSIRIKNKGLVPNRPVGVGYDSEASDTEIDPAIEEQFIIRMLPGEDCDYLRNAIENRLFNKSEFSFKPLTREGRRAIFKVRDKQYAAALVDLPCIIEGMKSWDRRGWYKSADICQMLLVLGPVSNEREALDYPLPPEVEVLDDKTLRYAHGLTPPLRWVRKRRFRERISHRTIEQVEKAVEDLVAQDEASLGPPRYELVDPASLNRAEGLVQSGEYGEEEYDDEQDAEGELEETMDEIFEDFEDSLAAEMEAALAAGAEGEGTDGAPAPPPADSGVYQAGTPSATKPSTPAAETSGDDSDESEGERGEPEEDLDDEQLEQQRQMQQQREEIAELEALIRAETGRWEKMQNRILKNKLAERIQHLRRDLSLKKVSIGEGDDADV
ncbi:TAFII55 protein conserved region-domain-containing protein [Aspergillus ambiguus]|uniref:transcription initiation factor TFIID subunit 7 family protein n=1 Tax=Aspergillus ambiguus TaxID=176160 RepID=UPI003CCD5F03